MLAESPDINSPNMFFNTSLNLPPFHRGEKDTLKRACKIAQPAAPVRGSVYPRLLIHLLMGFVA